MSIDCVLNRRSVREYTKEPVSDGHIKEMLRAGMYAPSAQNSQPWEFVVIRGRKMLDALSDGALYWKMLKRTPLAIAVTANLDGYKSATKDFFVQDCAACTQNILIAAEGLGLGGVWLGVYSNHGRVRYVSDILTLPDGIIPFSLISIGHPAKHPEPHDFFLGEKVHDESY
jgi:nitroreductase